MTALRKLLRRARTLAWTALSILIIFSAVLVGLGKLLMPYSDRYQPRLEAWLSEEFGQKVTLESFAGEWNAFGPRLSLRGLRFQPSAQSRGEVAIAEAALDLKPLNALIPGKALYNFLVIGADFRLVREAAGQYELSGLGVGGAESENEDSGLRGLVGIGELILEDSNLEFVDERNGTRLSLTDIDARLQLDGESVSLMMNAMLSDQQSGLVFGEVEASGLLQLAEESGLESAEWQIAIGEVLLGPLHSRLPPNPFIPQTGRINGEFWCDWSKGGALEVKGVFDLRKASLENRQRRISVEQVNTRLNWSYEESGSWRLDFNDLLFDDGTDSWKAPRISLARNLGEDLGLWLSADYLPLEVPLRLTRNVMAMYGTDWPGILPGAAQGSVSDVDIVLDSSWGIRMARGKAHHAGIMDWGRRPNLRGFDAEIDLKRGSGQLGLHASTLELDWPEMFEGPLEFSMPGCSIGLRWGTQWQVVVGNCSLMNDDISMSGEIVIAGNEGRPFVDANVQIPRGDIRQVSPYWPQGVMSDNTVGWLRNGLIAGDLRDGRVQIYGDMDYWPFRHGDGRFEAIAHVTGAELVYADGWPMARGIDVTTRFTGPGMFIEGSVADTGGVAAQKVTAHIPDLKAPLLRIQYEAVAPLDDFVDYVIQSPIDEQVNADLDQFEFAGPAETRGSLILPLGKTPGEMEVDGNVYIRGDRFFDPGSDVLLEEINGELHYTRKGLNGNGLAASYKGKPAVLDLQGDADGSERFRVDLSGVFDVVDVLPRFLQEGYEELGRIQGESDWLVSVVVPAKEEGQEGSVNLEIRSSLDGVRVDLPEPLNKDPGEIWPLELRYPLKGPSGLVDLVVKDQLHLRLDFPRDPALTEQEVTLKRASLNFGYGPAELPLAGFIRIQGLADVLDLDGWVDLVIDGVKEGRGLSGLGIEDFELAAQELWFLDRRFAGAAIALEINEADIKGTFTGDDINGHVVFNPESGASGSLTAEFERLVLAKPISSGLDMQADPMELPAVHLYAKSFSYSGIELGETRIEAYPGAEGFHFEKVEANSEQLSLDASGDWSLSEAGQRSDFKILITSESLGQLMQSLDISTSLEGGQTVLHFNAWWPGSPGAFALSRLNGEIEFSVSRGQITNASAGGGRLLGLLSVQALPRRLSLDFRDVFDSGFDFEEAGGTFQMENGTATTDDVLLSSSAARISLIGSTDLVAQQYDQLMTVQPGVGNTLPIIGAIAGGPGGAAAGLALQGLLHRTLGEATQVQYTITGTWDEPLIEPVERDNADG
ncbi:MAG TPA: YhdP family protein [Xanthomonadales bacterium]|nr:YhdP family protein [Xanthomonadales bacterium]